MTFFEWFLFYIPEFYVDMKGLFFYSKLEQGVWQERLDLQKAYPDPTGKNFVDFKRWFVLNAVKENMVDESAYKSWHVIWMHNAVNHREYHQEQNDLTNIGLNIIGWHGGQFSIAIQAVKLLTAARAVNISTNAIQLPPPPDKKFTHPSLLDYELSKSLSNAVNIVAVNADSAIYPKRAIPRIVWESKYNIGYWAWELDIFPKVWMFELRDYDEIWVPSMFIKESIETSTGYDGTPVRVLNLPLLQKEVTSNNTLEGPLPFELESETSGVRPFTFLVKVDFRSSSGRKNPQGPIRAFLDAFPVESDPHGRYRLVVKAHSGTAAEMEELEKEANNDPRVVFIFRVLPDSENIALHTYQDCYVSLHRSEGYGLNILESLGAGIPVISTGYSGNVEFHKVLDGQMGQCYFPVPYEIVTLEKDYGPYYTAGNHWAEPDHNYTVHAMRKVASNNCRQNHGREISKLMVDNFGEVAIGMKMKELLSDAGSRIIKKYMDFVSPKEKSLRKSLEKTPGWKEE